MDITSIIIGIVVAAGVVYFAYTYFKTGSVGGGPQDIVTSSVDGRKEFKSNESLPQSFNQQQGMTFSYTAWIRVDDYSYRYGQPKVIFTKGPEDLSSMCPAVMLDANTNTLLVKIDTFGTQEVIPISNLPAKKWFHFGLVVDQDSVDVYINGTLYTHQTLAQLPRQNPSSVIVGPAGGFDGRIANLKYYSYYLGPTDISALIGTPPTPSPEDKKDITPPYQDITWWIGRS
jgi:hypothetical protein